MSKPWDKLRVPMAAPPISCGCWQAHGGTLVQWEPALGHRIELKLNANESVTASYETWRQLGEFLIELTDQLSPK